MEIYTGIAVGVLAVIIVVVSLVIGCLIKHKCVCCRKKNKDHISTHYTVNRSVSTNNTNSTNQLIEEEEPDEDVDPGEITLKDVVDDELWIDDMTGVMHHCIPVLKGCRETTVKLVTMTVEFCSTDAQSQRLEAAARNVTPHVDDVVKLFDSPVDPRIIHSRCSMVVQSVLSLIATCRELCGAAVDLEWTEAAMTEIDFHLTSLEEHSANIRQSSVVSPNPQPKFSVETEDKDSENSRSSSCNADSGIEVHTPHDSVTNWSGSPSSAPVSPRLHTVTIEHDPSRDVESGHVRPSSRKSSGVGSTLGSEHHKLSNENLVNDTTRSNRAGDPACDTSIIDEHNRIVVAEVTETES